MIVYFATNRAPDAGAPGGYGTTPAPAVFYGAAQIDAAGAVTPGLVTTGAWSDELADEIIGAGKPLLAILHGFDYTLPEALQRAAELGALCQAQGADATILTFCWPSSGRLIEFPDLAGAYAHDQAMAAASAAAIAGFIGQIDMLRWNIAEGAPSARAILLCHSMGNYALAGALEQLRATDVFDEAILAAADEQADSFELAGGGRLGLLPAIARRQTIYFARHDEALQLSSLVNGNVRLGQDGPIDRQDVSRFPPTGFRLVDCTAIDPRSLNPDDSHQYYRTAPAVIADIAALVLGTAGAVGTLLEQPA